MKFFCLLFKKGLITFSTQLKYLCKSNYHTNLIYRFHRAEEVNVQLAVTWSSVEQSTTTVQRLRKTSRGLTGMARLSSVWQLAVTDKERTRQVKFP